MTAHARTSQTRAADIMSRPVLTIETGETFWDAWQMMFVSGLRHLVVLDDDGIPMGVLTDREILANTPATAEHLGSIRVRDVVDRIPRTSIHPDTTARDAANAMSDHAVEAIPVLDDDGRLVGIVTESDVVRWVATAP